MSDKEKLLKWVIKLLDAHLNEIVGWTELTNDGVDTLMHRPSQAYYLVKSILEDMENGRHKRTRVSTSNKTATRSKSQRHSEILGADSMGQKKL